MTRIEFRMTYSALLLSSLRSVYLSIFRTLHVYQKYGTTRVSHTVYFSPELWYTARELYHIVGVFHDRFQRVDLFRNYRKDLHILG
jgi:hypothetical protein